MNGLAWNLTLPDFEFLPSYELLNGAPVNLCCRYLYHVGALGDDWVLPTKEN
jgi:hypothetical protein